MHFSPFLFVFPIVEMHIGPPNNPWLQAVLCHIKVNSIGRLYIIDDEYFGEINPEASRYSGDGNFHEGTFFFPPPRRKFQRRASLPREVAAAKVSVIARDVLSLANTGSPGPAPIHHAVIDGKAKPLNAPNYLVNRAKCTRRALRTRRMTNERPVEYRRFRWDRSARFRALSRTRRNGKPPLQVNPTASAIRVNQLPGVEQRRANFIRRRVEAALRE